MNLNYVDKYFINPGIEYGIKSYLSYKEGNGYIRLHTIEMYVIKALTIIYGEKSILLPYQIDNEKAFECNLLMYDLKESDMKEFIKLMNDYYNFMEDFKSEKKATGLVTEIEKILIEMINKRSKRKEFTPEEINEFDKIFNPMDGDLKKIKSLVSTNNGLIVKSWNDDKVELSNTQLRMIAVNPKLLSAESYKKYGYDIRTIASLSELEIEDVNSIIEKEENRKNIKESKKISNRKKIVLTSGNGFVDKLMLASIIATEIMLGIIIAIQLGG